MPKGVEHCFRCQGKGVCKGPQNSVMPKGVEHVSQAVAELADPAPQNSVMPKGVEHTADIECGERNWSAKLRDAERR